MRAMIGAFAGLGIITVMMLLMERSPMKTTAVTRRGVQQLDGESPASTGHASAAPVTAGQASQPRAHAETATATAPPKQQVSLVLGDLPGYTGWRRPQNQTVGWYGISSAPEAASVGQPYVFTVECKSEDCKGHHAVFESRAYGPAFLPPVQKHDVPAGTYSWELVFPYAGSYVIELVLAYRNLTVSQLPINPKDGPDPTQFEGYLVPGFPVHVNVSGAALPTTGGVCSATNLQDGAGSDAATRGWWRVVSRDSSFTMPADLISHKGQLGFTTEYVRQGCELPQLSDLVARFGKHNKGYHLVMAGGSNTRIQVERLRAAGWSHGLTFVDMHGGYDNVKDRMEKKLATVRKSETRNILFVMNTGMHEMLRCLQNQQLNPRPGVPGMLQWSRIEGAPNSHWRSRTWKNCVEHYKKTVGTAIDMVKKTLAPTELIFETSHAAWPHWGNWGFSWPGWMQQHGPEFCRVFNAAIEDVLASAGVPSVDMYWLSAARQDSREPGAINNKMAHTNGIVYEVTIRKIITILLESTGAPY